MSTMTRRNMLAASAAAASAAAAGLEAKGRPTLCLFSKHLPQLGYKELAKTVKALGFDGVDLTCRPKGHVLPENAALDLPKAHAALAAEGAALPMITTGLVSIHDPAARPTLYTAAKLGVGYFKLGYYKLADIAAIHKELKRVKREVDGLAALAEHAGITGGFHNHSGAYVGSSIWDTWSMLEDVNPQAMGFYYDPCHATIEGGKAGWEIAFELIKSKLKMVACKDFFWEKVGGRWQATMCPLGQGMVNYPRFFKLLAESGFAGPISLHVEYEIEGPTQRAVEEKTLEAIERDFGYLKSEFEKAYGA